MTSINGNTDNTNPDTVTLTWGINGGHEKFQISYSPNPPDPPEETNDTQFTFTDLTPGETYNFTIIAINSVGNESEEAFEVVNMCKFTEIIL